MIKYDAIVIGAGHNGLVTAAYLGRAGQRVLVLERRDSVGGTLATEEVFPGFKYDIGPSPLDWLHPRVAQDLELSRYGLEIVSPDTGVFAPLPDGAYLSLGGDREQTLETIRRFSPSDAGRWAAFCDQAARLSGFLPALYSITPPRIADLGPGDARSLWGLVAPLRRLGQAGAVELLRTLPMSVKEYLDEWFEGDLLRGTLGAAGIRGLFQGPYASGTAYVLLHHLVDSTGRGFRSPRFVRGGTGNLSRALAGAARRHGVEIRTRGEVARVRVQGGRATGVVLGSGEEAAAERVVSNADPRRTFFQLVDPLYLAPEFVRKVRNIKFRGAGAKMNLALDRLPRFVGAGEDGRHVSGVISISPSLAYLERAYDDAKYGQMSRHPYLEVSIPSLADPSLAPPGKHVMSVWVQYAPYRLKEGAWDDAARAALGDRVVQTLAEYAPGLAETILHCQVLTPGDFESDFGLTEGSLYHGELTLDQILFMRPVGGWAQYRTPIERLYLCGAGTHPGGGVIGAPGYNAAREILAEKERK